VSNKECDYSIVTYTTEWCLNLHIILQLQIIYDTIIYPVFNVLLLLNQVSWLLLVLYHR